MSKTTKKNVTFPSDPSQLSNIVCMIGNRDEITEEDKELLWFSSADYGAIRSSAHAVSQESRRTGYSKILDRIFCEKNQEAQSNLNFWCVHGHIRRGLEKFVHRQLRETRKEKQLIAIMDVLCAQDDMMKTCDRNKTISIDHDQLRKISIKATRVARHFARMIGKADAYAIACEQGNAYDMTEMEISLNSTGLVKKGAKKKEFVQKISNRNKNGVTKRIPRIA